ncbi:uncharacterized protein PHACADRAFT_204939 [Phanerochaete carnosa HHB-10118-sp]|nr:uncharacterized protein PHACADRAFT_204939 [Phanerochaete carnosa HHB-10118-sp]EKM61785.1 hypothetical protein PHACADRAFT_204939 [Phanerochaete carnosa HHB-10118-sp]
MSTLPAPHLSLPAKPTFAAAVLPSRPDNAPAATGATLGSRSGAKRDTREELLTPWLERLPVTQYNSTEQRLHDEIVAFMNYATPNATERTVRERLIARLTEIIQRRYWCSDVKVFGSMAQDLSLLSG